MGVKLRKRKYPNGDTSLYLDIYHHGRRRCEFLNNLKLVKATTIIEREKNRELLALAEQIRDKRAQELQGTDYDIMPKWKSNVDLVTYVETYVGRYTKKDKRVIISTQNKLKEFLAKTGRRHYLIKQVDEAFVDEFKNYLEENLNGVTPCNYFTKFKKVLKQATREGLFSRNPAEGISIRSHQGIQKDILNFEEIELLCKTRITNEQVKRAFIFSCYTGLRWCDVNALKWKDINLKNRMISMLQQKTGVRVNVNLHESLTPILGNSGSPESRVFTLPSYTSCRKDLKYWVKKAGINKNITWHCARHSFATNLIFHGADVNSASNLLGHTSFKYTQQYTHIVASLKEKAVNNLPTIDYQAQ